MISRFFFISLFFCLSMAKTTLFSVENTMSPFEFLDQWQSTYAEKMTPEELKTSIALLYAFYSNAVITEYVYKLRSEMVLLNQCIRMAIEKNSNPAKELSTLKTLLDHLSTILIARTIYNKLLAKHLDEYNHNEKDIINNAVTDIQLYAQALLLGWSDHTFSPLKKQLQKSSQLTIESLNYLQKIADLHKMLSEGNFPSRINPEDEHNKSLLARSLIMNSSPDILAVIDTLTNELNITTEYATQILTIGTEIYKQFYTILYNRIKIIAIQDGNPSLENNYLSSLPEPDSIFEHILHITELYRKINENTLINRGEQ